MDRRWSLFVGLVMVSGGIGLVTMFVAVAAKDVTLSIFGLGILILGLTVGVLQKLDQIRSAIHGSGDKVETVLKQRLH